MPVTTDYYDIAMKIGKKEIQSKENANLSTELPVLDEIIKDVQIVAEIPLGLVDIPLDQMVGTKTRGRTTSFAPNFMPILDDGSEFAMKWSSLCEAHLTEGIRDPIKAYEYMNKYYVQEGNKRVSVMKYFHADSIAGYVTRLVPARDDTEENRIYYEFLDFYNATSINYLTLSHRGGYLHMCHLVGYHNHQRWSIDDRINFRSCYVRMEQAFRTMGGYETHSTVGDALLIYMDLFGYEVLKNQTPDEILNNLKKIWEEILLYEKDSSHISIKFDPATDTPKKNLLAKLLTPSEIPTVKVAFIHRKTAETSSWTYQHELGRQALTDALEGKVITTAYDNVDNSTDAYEVIEKAIAEGNKIIFTTSPAFMQACIKSAVEHPDVKIFNCSVNASHKYIRTYYGRMFEAKFLSGVLAGAMTDTDKIGYVADYPIVGMIANINAFAIGVKMVNPKAKIYLEWSTALENQGVDLTQKFYNMGVTYISNQDMIVPSQASRQFGLYRINGETPVNLATTVVDWGKYYELILRNLQRGTWSAEEKEASDKAVTYWWGMSADVIDIIFSSAIPTETRLLLDTLRDSIKGYDLNPFNCTMHDQDGNPVNLERINKGPNINPGEVIGMNWLMENVIGHIPVASELVEDARDLVTHAGVRHEEEQ